MGMKKPRCARRRGLKANEYWTGLAVDNGHEVLLAVFAVVQGDAVWIFDGFVCFVFADDPAVEVLVDEPLSDALEVDLAFAHEGPFRIAVPVLVVDVIDERAELLHLGQRIHAAVGDVANVGSPSGDARIEAVENDCVVFFGTVDGSVRRIRVEGTAEASFGRALGNGIDAGHEVEAALFEIVAAIGHLHGTKRSAGELLQGFDDGVGLSALFVGFFGIVPVEHESDAGELDVVLLELVGQLGGIGKIAHPEVHRFDAFESCLLDHFDHVAELVIVSGSGFPHEPCIDFSA